MHSGGQPEKKVQRLTYRLVLEIKKNIGYPTDGSWVREEVPVGDP